MVVRRLFPILVPLLLAGGCRRESAIEVYEVPKESSPVVQSDPHGGGDPHAGMDMSQAGGDPHAAAPSGGQRIEPGVSGEVPDHWEVAGGSSMRVASYRVDGEGEDAVDISLFVLAGTAGGALDNINRWRRQIGLDEIDEAGLAAGSEKRRTPVGEALVVDLVPEEAGRDRIVAAIIPVSTETWFYKMRGDKELVGREKEAFLRWIETAEVKVELPEPTPPVESPHGSAPAADIRWEKPAGWLTKPGDSLRIGSFATEGGAEITVIRLGGDGGGDLPNVNRWRGQIGLEPLASLEGALQDVEAGGLSMPVIDMEGAESRTVAAWTLREGESWFFKLTGPKDAVSREREAFLAFLKSIRFGES